MKTTKSAASRFKVSGTGKVIRRKIGQRHLHITKSRSNLRRGKQAIVIHGIQLKKVRRLLGI